eukprot:g3921.t1
MTAGHVSNEDTGSNVTLSFDTDTVAEIGAPECASTMHAAVAGYAERRCLQAHVVNVGGTLCGWLTVQRGAGKCSAETAVVPPGSTAGAYKEAVTLRAKCVLLTALTSVAFLIWRAGGVGAIIAGAVRATQEQIDVVGLWPAVAAYSVFMAVWIACCGPTTIMEVAPGAIFGFYPGAVASIAGKNLGNYLCFFVGRYAARDYVRRVMLGKYRVLRVIERLLERRGFAAVFMVRLCYLPMPIKNYGLSVLGVPFPQYAAAAFITGVPFAFMWVKLGTKCEDIHDVLSGKVTLQELTGAEGGAGGGWQLAAQAACALAIGGAMMWYGRAAWQEIAEEERAAAASSPRAQKKRA